MTSPKNGDKSKKTGKGKKAGPQKTAASSASGGSGDKRAARNVALIRDKLAIAMEDPQMREQIVRAMRNLLYEDKS